MQSEEHGMGIKPNISVAITWNQLSQKLLYNEEYMLKSIYGTMSENDSC